MWHKKQKNGDASAGENSRRISDNDMQELRESEARFSQLVAPGLQLKRERDYAKAARKFCSAIELEPDSYVARWNLGVVLLSSSDMQGACSVFVEGAERSEVLGSTEWAKCTTNAFGLLAESACEAVPRPQWWDDADLLQMSRMVVEILESPMAEASASTLAMAHLMRANVLDTLISRNTSTRDRGGRRLARRRSFTRPLSTTT